MDVEVENSDRHTDFEYIYIYYFPKMKRFAREYVLSDEDAENIVQDVFLELWEKKEILSLQLNVIAYLFTAIRNRCINFLRRSMIAKNAENKLQEEYKLTLQMKYYSLEAFNQEIFQEKDVEQILSKAIDTLPEKCREIFILSKIKGKKQKDIATELNISVNTVETQISIAYKKLRNELKEHFPLFYFLLCLCNDIT
ncbi:RNA polymerase sigma-70 factor [Bacteroides salyersiae]|uniref:RNA polymerase sigma-70 factor n=1 Tax=Bacteroides salyersiae TaxID=291644 RepID=UPI00189729FE|nr:RNA polymerase sigma-70 factor [Bacteroides salyersiae]